MTRETWLPKGISLELIEKSCAAVLGERGDLLGEAIQETTIRIWSLQESGTEIRHPKAFVAKLCRNMCFNILRDEEKHQRNRHYSMTEDRDPRIRHRQDQHVLLVQILDHWEQKLNQRQRHMIQLIFVGCTQQEIADELGLSKARVNQEIAGIREKIQRFTSCRQ